LKDALTIDQSNVLANRALGTFYVASGRIPEAEPYFKTIASAVDTPAAQASLAQYYVLANRFDDARVVLKKLLTRKDAEEIATVRLAALDARDGQRAQAEDRLRAFLVGNQKDLPAQLLYASILLRNQKRDEAEAAVKMAIALDPNSARAHELAGQIDVQSDRIDAALQEYEKVLALDSRSYPAALELSRLHLRLGHQEKSESYGQQAVAIVPGSPEAQDLLARNYLARGENAKADTIVARLKKDFPKAPAGFNLAALLQLSRHDTAAAHASYKRALELDPINVEALSGIVRLDVLAHSGQSAIERLDAASSSPKVTADLLLAVARGYAMAGEKSKTEATLIRTIQLDPIRLQGYNLLGQLYAQQNRLRDAREQFESLLKRDPKSVPGHTMMGMIEESQGHLPEAEQSYQRALAIDAKAPVAANNLAWIYAASNRQLDDAMKLAQVAFEQLGDDPHVADTLGWIFIKKDLASRAVPLLETATTQIPDEPDFRYHLGVAYFKAGNWKKSRPELEKALSLKATLAGAEDARKILAIVGS
jgi:tetratricopeptide (TPR) repeat protein